MRSLALAAVLVVAFASGGCFQMTTVVNVKGDGSGTVDHTMLVTKAALAQLRQFAALAGGRGQSLDLVSEEQARAMASTLGPGVTYVSSSPIDTPLGQGRRSTYAFKDITELRISERPQTGGLSVKSDALNQAAGEITCTFTREPDGNATLRIHLPELNLAGAFGNAAPGSPEIAQQLAMVRTLLAGAHVTIAVEPAGQLARTTSPYVDGPRVTLLDADLDQLLGNEAFITQLQTAKTPEEVKAALKDVPGLKMTLDREVTIEFTPAK